MTKLISRTSGNIAFDSNCIGRAIALATPSGLISASRFGTSSPRTSAQTAIPITTIQNARPCAYGRSQATCEKVSASLLGQGGLA